VKTDVADEASAQGAVAAAFVDVGGLQGPVGCAGIMHGEKVIGKGARMRSKVRTPISINLVGMSTCSGCGGRMSKGAPNAEGERASS